jgi:hypothetical protein
MLAVPSRAAARLPHLSVHDVSEIDAEVWAVLTETGLCVGKNLLAYATNSPSVLLLAAKPQKARAGAIRNHTSLIAENAHRRGE